MKYRILIYPFLWSDNPVYPCKSENFRDDFLQHFPNLPSYSGNPYTRSARLAILLRSKKLAYAVAAHYCSHFKAAYCVIEVTKDKNHSVKQFVQEGLYYNRAMMSNGALRDYPNAYPLACLN